MWGAQHLLSSAEQAQSEPACLPLELRRGLPPRLVFGHHLQADAEAPCVKPPAGRHQCRACLTSIGLPCTSTCKLGQASTWLTLVVSIRPYATQRGSSTAWNAWMSPRPGCSAILGAA